MYGNIVLASTKSGFIPSAIKWFTGSQFSHSFITIPDILNTPMGVEAGGNGVDCVRFDTNYQNNTDQGYEVWSIKINPETADTAIISMLNDLEISYGYFQYFWFIWRKLNSIFGRDIKSQNNWINKGMICSQLCVAYLKVRGLTGIFEGYGEGSIEPQDLQNIFKANPDIFEKVESVRL